MRSYALVRHGARLSEGRLLPLQSGPGPAAGRLPPGRRWVAPAAKAPHRGPAAVRLPQNSDKVGSDRVILP